MVTTRSHRKSWLSKKALRLHEALRRKGMVKGCENFMFGGSNTEKRLTVLTSTWKKMNPCGIFFLAKNDDGTTKVLLAGCIHSDEYRCKGCYYPDSKDIDIKDDRVFALVRSWAVCTVWNLDPYVVGDDTADFTHCSLPDKRDAPPLMLTY